VQRKSEIFSFNCTAVAAAGGFLPSNLFPEEGNICTCIYAFLTSLSEPSGDLKGLENGSLEIL